MSYIGSTPANKLVTSSDMEDGIVTTAKIANDAATADKIANAVNSAITANTSKTTNATHSGEVTGSGALTIAGNVVDEANLKVSNSPTNGYGLVARSGNTGGMTWEALGGGKLLQVVSATKTDTFTVSGAATTVVPDLSINITPSATSSKILLFFNGHFNSNDYGGGLSFFKGGSQLVSPTGGVSSRGIPNMSFYQDFLQTASNLSMHYLDSPSSTSQLTYDIRIFSRSGTNYFNRTGTDSDNSDYARTISTITAMEIGV